MLGEYLCWWVVVLGDVLAGQGCSLGIVVVVPGNSGNTSGDSLGEGCVLGGRGVSRIPLIATRPERKSLAGFCIAAAHRWRATIRSQTPTPKFPVPRNIRNQKNGFRLGNTCGKFLSAARAFYVPSIRVGGPLNTHIPRLHRFFPGGVAVHFAVIINRNLRQYVKRWQLEIKQPAVKRSLRRIAVIIYVHRGHDHRFGQTRKSIPERVTFPV